MKTFLTSDADTPDADLVAAYRAGDEAAFRVLIERYTKALYAFIYRYFSNVGDTEDVVQETFIRVWRHLRTFDTQRSFKTWLYTIGRNVALDLAKKKKAILLSNFESLDEEPGDLLSTIVDPAPLPDEVFSRTELAQELEHMLQKLPPASRLVLHLHHHDQLTFQEIAEIIGEPLDTVKSRYRRSLVRLRNMLVPSETAPKCPPQS